MNSRFFLETESLRYAYRKQDDFWVIKDIDLGVRQDEYLLICGASGSGKSTLCRTFNGLIPHFYGGKIDGDIRVSGKTTLNQSVGDLFMHVGMVFQNPETQLFNHTVAREITFGLESLGLSRSEIQTRVNGVADSIKIKDLLQRNPHELSGGEQQLVAIAAILSLHPQILVLDEPYANLDPINVRRVRDALRSILKQGIGVIVCEHRLALTVADAHRMLVLNHGGIELDGPPDALLNRSLESFGLEPPLSVRVGERMGLTPVALDIETLKSRISHQSIPPDLKPDFPELHSAGAKRILEVEDITFSMDNCSILENISFALHEGESIAIVGANGAGKTVLLKHLNGLYRPKTGNVRIMGKDTRAFKVSRLARHIGIAFQNPNSQFFKLNVWDEITAGAEALDCFDAEWLQDLIKLFRLEPLLKRASFRLSGGEKKRVAFAAALAPKPMILALDEPTAGQDWYFRRALGDLLKELRDRGQAIILVTHDLSFAEQHTHRWLLMAEGRIVKEGTPWNVMSDKTAMEKAHLEPTDAFRLFGYESRKTENAKPIP
ncbi:MAG: ABC transporter ATP-binding protein [Deltaproteobacteria bacterium]|nr:ABC transporter ATP-binding protein [Deltaproteobacteria bacterium]